MFVVTSWVIQVVTSSVITVSSSMYNELAIKGKYVIHVARSRGLNKPSVTENVIYALQREMSACI